MTGVPQGCVLAQLGGGVREGEDEASGAQLVFRKTYSTKAVSLCEYSRFHMPEPAVMPFSVSLLVTGLGMTLLVREEGPALLLLSSPPAALCFPSRWWVVPPQLPSVLGGQHSVNLPERQWQCFRSHRDLLIDERTFQSPDPVSFFPAYFSNLSSTVSRSFCPHTQGSCQSANPSCSCACQGWATGSM